MSPFRIIGRDSKGNRFILCAMLSTNKKDGTRRVYILHKPMLPEMLESSGKSLLETEKDVAYSLSTKSNSSIIETYAVNRTEDRFYELSRIRKLSKNATGLTVTEKVYDSSRTLFDCQKTAMEHYCIKTGVEIISIL